MEAVFDLALLSAVDNASGALGDGIAQGREAEMFFDVQGVISAEVVTC